MKGERKVAQRLSYVAKEVGIVTVVVVVVVGLVTGLCYGYLWLRGLVPESVRETVFNVGLVVALIVAACCLFYLILAPLYWWLSDLWRRSGLSRGD